MRYSMLRRAWKIVAWFRSSSFLWFFWFIMNWLIVSIFYRTSSNHLKHSDVSACRRHDSFCNYRLQLAGVVIYIEVTALLNLAKVMSKCRIIKTLQSCEIICMSFHLHLLRMRTLWFFHLSSKRQIASSREFSFCKWSEMYLAMTAKIRSSLRMMMSAFGTRLELNSKLQTTNYKLLTPNF